MGAKDNAGKTALDWAFEKGHTSAINILLERYLAIAENMDSFNRYVVEFSYFMQKILCNITL